MYRCPKTFCPNKPGPHACLACLIEQNEAMLAALLHVRKIIVEAAETGFNWKDGNWAEQLFASQAVTFAAVEKTQEGAGRNALAPHSSADEGSNG